MRIGLLLGCFIPFFGLHGYFNGNPELPQMIDEGMIFAKDNLFSVRFSYEGDLVINQKMEGVNLVGSSFNQFSSLMNQGVVTLNFFDRYDAYVSMGAVEYKMHQHLASDHNVSYQTDNHWTFGAGGRILILQYDQFFLGVDGKYQYAFPEIRYIERDGSSIIPKQNSSVLVHGWQVGVSGSYHIDIFSPYIGVKFLYERAGFENIPLGTVSSLDSEFKAKNQNPVGIFVGVLISSGRDFSLGIESRMIDESAVTLTLDLKF